MNRWMAIARLKDNIFPRQFVLFLERRVVRCSLGVYGRCVLVRPWMVWAVSLVWMISLLHRQMERKRLVFMLRRIIILLKLKYFRIGVILVNILLLFGIL